MWMCPIRSMEDLPRIKRLGEREPLLPDHSSWTSVFSCLWAETGTSLFLGLESASLWTRIYSIGSPGSLAHGLRLELQHRISWILGHLGLHNCISQFVITYTLLVLFLWRSQTDEGRDYKGIPAKCWRWWICPLTWSWLWFQEQKSQTYEITF